MNSLNNYLHLVHEDFQNYIEKNDKYCELLDLNFRGEHLPDYQKDGIVQLYLLRYAYAYLFEYKHIFKSIIDYIGPSKFKKLRILSVGCGNYLDYWGAALACNEFKESIGIKYTGIDPVNWRYKVTPRHRDNIQFEQKTFYEFLKNIIETEEELNINIIIFPKSIGEFSSDEFREICSLLKRCRFKRKKIALIFSFRDARRLSDMNRVAMIVDAFKNHKMESYAISNYERDRCYGIKKDIGICAIDANFIYPKDILEYITSLTTLCTQQNIMLGQCRECSTTLARYPILKTNYIAYSWALIRRKEI